MELAQIGFLSISGDTIVQQIVICISLVIDWMQKFDPRQPQIILEKFDTAKLEQVAIKVIDVYAKAYSEPDRDGEADAVDAIDITAPEFVEMKTDGKVVWVNVDGVCVLRVCRAKIIVVNDEARYRTYKTPKGGE